MATSAPYLSEKQFSQLMNLAAKTQSFLCNDTSTFIELLNITFRSSNPHYLKAAVDKFKVKYYPKGYKENKRPLNPEQRKMVFDLYQPRFQPSYKPYKDLERTAFLRVVRACRTYLFSGMAEDDRNLLVERIEQSYELLPC